MLILAPVYNVNVMDIVMSVTKLQDSVSIVSIIHKVLRD